MDQSALRGIYKRAIKMNADAFSGQEFDLAYHALMVALHAGQRLNDVKLLRKVERLGYEQLKFIDEHHPEYIHSTRSAKQRGHSSIFQTAASQAGARILMIEGPKLKSAPLGFMTKPNDV